MTAFVRDYGLIIVFLAGLEEAGTRQRPLVSDAARALCSPEN